MRLLKTGGSTPCDRRLDRRKVALAAVIAALFLAATAPRVIADTYVINHALSSIKLNVTLVDWPTGNLIGTTPLAFSPSNSFGDGQQLLDTPDHKSDSAFVSGTINATVGGGMLTLNSGSSIVPDTTGVYFPSHTGTSDPPTTAVPPAIQPGWPVNGPPVPGNFGLISFAILGATVAMFNDMTIDFGTPAQGTYYGLGAATPFGTGPIPMFAAGNVPSAMTLSGPGNTGSFSVVGQTASYGATTVTAFQNINALDNNTASAAGITNNLGVSDMVPLVPQWLPNATAGSLTAGGVLTIPFNSTTGLIIDDNGGPGPFLFEVISYTGSIVANLVVPEPSSMTLLGLGVVGLLSTAWRARKRKAMAA
jgi:hypothetical protein